MTLIEAVKSGKRFRRGTGEKWCDPKHYGTHGFLISDLIAEDWVTEPEKKKLYAFIRKDEINYGSLIFSHSDFPIEFAYRVPQFDVEVEE